jgi:hypothetical protein
MANLDKSLKLLFQVEFSNKPNKFLHKNAGEDGCTLGGVYQKYNKTNIDWNFVEDLLAKNDGNIKRTSVELFLNERIMSNVKEVYRDKYWNYMKLDDVKSQKIADEMFLFGVVAHPRNAIKLAQSLVNVTVDGLIGNQTLNALNSFDESKFDIDFDILEKYYFEELVVHSPRLAINLKGWKNRADFA